MADVTGHARCSSPILDAPLSECSSVGRMLAVVVVAESGRRFESVLSVFEL